MPRYPRTPHFETPPLDIVLISSEPHMRASHALGWLDLPDMTDGAILTALDVLRAKTILATPVWTREATPETPDDGDIIPYVTLAQLAALADHFRPGTSTTPNWDLDLRHAIKSYASLATLQDQITQYLRDEPCTKTALMRRFASSPRDYLLQAIENLTLARIIQPESIRLGERGPATQMYRLCADVVLR